LIRNLQPQIDVARQGYHRSMSDSSNEELRLRATEEQMRRALGLREERSSAPQNASPAASPGAPHPYRRRFVREGEVPVIVVHRDHDDGAGINRIDTVRQALREQVAARERAEHLLQEARTAIQTLETKLAHERIGKDEALRRLEDELAAERTARQRAEKRLGEALLGRKEPSMVTSRGSAARTDPGDKMQPARRRGRPPKVRPSESAIVEWWVPGWREKLP
jgi:hypothetical protein